MINWLENWLINHFDEFNESEEWIQIDTLDNPGWTVSIDTVGTELYIQKIPKRNQKWINLLVKEKI